mgnify:CR=1 FL=1
MMHLSKFNTLENKLIKLKSRFVLLDKDEVKNMSKNQAALALKSFYADNGIKGFEKVSDGGKGTLVYILGKLTTSGKSYSITVQLKQKNGTLYIITMRIS